MIYNKKSNSKKNKKMKTEILFLFILISFVISQSQLAISGAEAGTCTSSDYTFTLKGKLTGGAAETTFSATTNPSTTTTCTLETTAETEQTDVTLSCKATGVTLSSATLQVTGLTKTGSSTTTFSTLTATASIASVTCPSGGNVNPQPSADNTFTAKSIPVGTCGSDGVYTFTISGSLSAATASALSITPTFTSPTKPTVTCSLPITATSNIGSANIECKVTSSLSSATITVSALSGQGITFSGLPQTMSGTATCAGKTDDSGNNGSDANGKFIQFSKFLIFTIFVFL